MPGKFITGKVVNVHIAKDTVQKYYCSFASLRKFKSLMSDSRNKIIVNLAKYLYYAFKHRESLLSD